MSKPEQINGQGISNGDMLSESTRFGSASLESNAEAALNSLSPDEIYNCYQGIINNGNENVAIWSLQKILESFPDYAIAHNDLGVLYYNKGDKERSLMHYQRAAQLQPENIIFQKNLADFYYVELGRVKEAMQIYVKVLSAYPEDIEALMVTAHLCVSLRQFDDAKIFYRRIMDIEPWNYEARDTLEKLDSIPVLNETGDEKMNTEKSPDELYENIQSIITMGQYEEAIYSLEGLLNSYPDYAIAHNDLGVLYFNRGDKEKSLMHYERAAQLQPENITFQKNLADFYYVELGRVEEAMKIYVNVLSAYPEDIETLLVTAHLCVSLRKFDDAKVFYKRVLEIEPWNSDATENLRKLEGNQAGNTINTITENNIQSYNISDERSPDEKYESIQSIISMERYEEAIASLEDLVNAYPDYAIAHNDLGVLHFNKGKKEKALMHYEKAVDLQPENITFQKNLADFYCVVLGRAKDAMKIYLKVLTSHPDDVETLINIGHLCVSYNQIEDAKFFYQRALDVEPWNLEARENFDKIGSNEIVI